jgi:hypothetical protein
VLPGERITLIKKVAERLAGFDPEDMQLTLGQFGVSYQAYIDGNFNFDSFRTALQSVEHAPDETLVALHEYLFGAVAPSAPGASGGEDTLASIWTPGEFRLFLSHTSEHKKEVGDLQMFLHLRGVSGFVAHADIEPTHEWQDVIETALRTCDALSAYLTPDFHESRWTDQEVGFSVARAVLIVPIKIGQDPYGFIGKFQALQGAGKSALDLSNEIADVLVAHPLTAARMAPPTVRAFASSNTYNEARGNFARLQRIPVDAWTPELLDLATEAVEANDQLSECVVPNRKPLPEALATLVDSVRSNQRTS